MLHQFVQLHHDHRPCRRIDNHTTALIHRHQLDPLIRLVIISSIRVAVKSDSARSVVPLVQINRRRQWWEQQAMEVDYFRQSKEALEAS